MLKWGRHVVMEAEISVFKQKPLAFKIASIFSGIALFVLRRRKKINSNGQLQKTKYSKLDYVESYTYLQGVLCG